MLWLQGQIRAQSMAAPHMGRQLNQQRGISWVAWGMPHVDWLARHHRPLWSTTVTTGSTFTLQWGSVCTFAPISVMAVESCCLICTAKCQLASFLTLNCAWVASTIHFWSQWSISSHLWVHCCKWSTHLLAGHLASHLKKKHNTNTLMSDMSITYFSDTKTTVCQLHLG